MNAGLEGQCYNVHIMLDRMREDLKHKYHLVKERPILVGVSGGPDSLCLLDVLWRSGYSLEVAHLDHSLRMEAASDAKFVRIVTEKLGVPIHIGKKNVEAFAEIEGYTLEEAARIARYTFLFEQAYHIKAQAVAVGHTADDQVETVLMHLLRGAGLTGLRGMAQYSLPTNWSQEIPLIRPLLSYWRVEIEAYIVKHHLEPVLDKSNQDTRFMRNRLRHNLIPILETYNPQIKKSLWRTADIIRMDLEILDGVVLSAWDKTVSEDTRGYISFFPQDFRDQPTGIQRQLVRRAVAKLQPDIKDLGFDIVEKALKFLVSAKGTSQSDFTAGLGLVVEKNSLYVAHSKAELPVHDWPQVNVNDFIDIRVPGKISFPNGWEIQAREAVLDDIILKHVASNVDPFQAWIATENLQFPMKIRARKPGDYLRPLGMQGHKVKLSHFMINEKIPKRARETWPLVVSTDEIIWVPGYRLAHPYRVVPDTERIVHLQLKKK